MKTLLAQAVSGASRTWDRFKQPVKRSYQVPLMGVAHVYRRLLRNTRFIGVTGSLGKTQTKTLVAAALAQDGRVKFDPSTDNRTYDVAKVLLQTSPFDRYCVQEIGMDGPGTMERPVGLFQPDIGIITNIRSDHSVGFPSRHAHVLEKARMIRDLPDDGWAILNADEPDLDTLSNATKANVVTYGLSERADVRAERVSSGVHGEIQLDVMDRGELHTIETRLYGQHNAHAVLAALAVARVLGVPLARAAAAIAATPATPGRMQFVEHEDGVAFLLDDYKASVGSLSAILGYLESRRADAGNVFVVLGTLMHGSEDSTSDYRDFIEKVRPYADHVLLVGKAASQLEKKRLPNDICIFPNVKLCHEYLQPRLKGGDLVVLKARLSRDHLRRIEIARRRPVKCWQMSCYRTLFCENCAFIDMDLN